jgi:D-alanyl-D-alanine carboxypeptidase/D-alanyl-D-alanine-endopeptidase (penicillin-binding protein 4)
MWLTRRQVLAGIGATLGTAAHAEAPLRSYRPIVRVSPRAALDGIVARAGISGQVGVALGDPATGEVLETYNAAVLLPPASVTKAVTALYALETLGADHRFTTRVLAQGTLRDGILDGHLIIVGGGDPDLGTDEMARLVDATHASGLREVRGDFLVWDGALPTLDQIDPAQLPHVGYNPALGGLNLNYNRVHFEWRRQGQNFVTTMDARSETHRPPVTIARMRVVDRDQPVFTHARDGDVDDWTVARSALNADGSRWLPVRAPALYAAEVFAVFARSKGIVLGNARVIPALPQAVELARHDGQPLAGVLAQMMRYSTNITAEALGLTATARIAGQLRGLRASAQDMARWAGLRAPGIAAQFVDHSGLGDASQISAADMVAFLQARDAQPRLRPLMRDIRLVDQNQTAISAGQAGVQAKTGTLNFVSALAGYLRTAGGRDLSFAIFAADLEARDRGKALGEEIPPGARRWNAQARRLQQDILQQWALRAY